MGPEGADIKGEHPARGEEAAMHAQAGREPAISLHEVTKRFRTPSRTFYTAVRDLSLTVARGEFCAIVGPTGSGK